MPALRHFSTRAATVLTFRGVIPLTSRIGGMQREFARCRDDNWYLRLLCRNFSWGLSAKTRSHSKVADASPTAHSYRG